MPSDLRLHLAPTDDEARAEELERGEAILVLLEMTERYGLDRVHSWLSNLAAIQGRDVCQRR